MPTLTIELSEEEYENAMEMPREVRDQKISAVFATARNTPAPIRKETSPFPYFDGDDVVTPNGRRRRRPWNGQTKWDGKSTNPDDHPDFDDMTAETSASVAAGILDVEAGRVRNGKEVMQEMRARVARGEFTPSIEEPQVRAYRDGK